MKFILFMMLSVHVSAATVPLKVLNFCAEAGPTALNPQMATDATTFSITRHIYDRLVDFEYGETKLKPALSERWSVSSDGLSYTFILRKNVKWQSNDIFQPSRTFNADDVIFSFTRQAHGEGFEYYTSMDMDKIIREIKKIDNDKVVFVLNKPNAAFVANLAMDFASILSQEYNDQLKKRKTLDLIDTKPIGTGPFVFKNYQKNIVLQMESFKDYWHGPAKIQNLNFIIATDTSQRLLKLKSGECDIVSYPSPAQIDTIKNEKQFVVL